LPWTHACEAETTNSYPSLIDHAAGDQNFSTISPEPVLYLYFTETTFSGCGSSRQRKLFRHPLRLTR